MRRYAPLVPELICSDIERSLRFYRDVLGFSVLYARPDERFAYLDRDGAQVMIEQSTGRAFLAGGLEYPYGRGMNLQIAVQGVADPFEDVRTSGSPVYLDLEEVWYRRGEVLVGIRQFIVQDPDGYLLRFSENLGEQPAPAR